MSSRVHIDCDVCKASHPATVDLFKWCPTCEHKVCFRCWVTVQEDSEAPSCPVCNSSLVAIDSKKMKDLEMKDLLGALKDNPHTLRGQSLHMESACIPSMNLSSMRMRFQDSPQKKGLLARIANLFRKLRP